jgi:dGTPase
MARLKFYHPGDYDREVDIPDSGSPEPYRSPFRRDFARIVHAPAFRRLQRKTQLFPGDESDFFKNRLTHSLKVAQIAKSIAIRLNYLVTEKYKHEADGINTDLIELVSFAHDLGHPPFGHTGELALQEKMHKTGGFEGNAQTLRILSRLEKRQTIPRDPSSATDFVEFADGKDLRVGLNLCFRSLAGVLKYDDEIPLIGASSDLSKGYYASEAPLVKRIRQALLGSHKHDGKLKVIEMQIMDLADDIAYSTYDFEDALKAGFGSPLDIVMQLNSNVVVRDAVARKLFKTETGREYPKDSPSAEDLIKFEKIQKDMSLAVYGLLKQYFEDSEKSIDLVALQSADADVRLSAVATLAVKLQKLSEQIAQNGYVRALFTSDVVGKRIRTIDIEVDEKLPALSKIKIPKEVRFEIDVLKHLTYELHIKSPRLKLI